MVQFSFISLINIEDINTTVLKKTIFTPISGVGKLSVLVIVAISTVLTINMNGDVLAVLANSICW
jgi:hypothetical protein